MSFDGEKPPRSIIWSNSINAFVANLAISIHCAFHSYFNAPEGHFSIILISSAVVANSGRTQGRSEGRNTWGSICQHTPT